MVSRSEGYQCGFSSCFWPRTILAEDATAWTSPEVWDYASNIINGSGVLAGGEELVGRYLAGIWQHAYDTVGAAGVNEPDRPVAPNHLRQCPHRDCVQAEL